MTRSGSKPLKNKTDPFWRPPATPLPCRVIPESEVQLTGSQKDQSQLKRKKNDETRT